MEGGQRDLPYTARVKETVNKSDWLKKRKGARAGGREALGNQDMGNRCQPVEQDEYSFFFGRVIMSVPLLSL